MGLIDFFCVENLELSFNSQKNSPGSTVSGIAEFEISGDLNIRSMHMEVVGRERTHVARLRGKGSSGSRQESICPFLNLRIWLIGDPNSAAACENHFLPPGTYRMPFEFLLPEDAPPTMTTEGPLGCSAEIEYFVKVFIDIPWTVGVVATAPFEVVGRKIPLSQLLEHQSLKRFSEQLVCVDMCCADCLLCWSRDAGFVAISVDLGSSLIVLDREDEMLVEADVKNHSSVTLQGIKVSLVVSVSFRVSRRERLYRVAVAENFIENEVPSGERAKVASKLRINPESLRRRHPPTSFTGVYIKVRWHILVECVAPWGYVNPSAVFEIAAAQSVDVTSSVPRADFDRPSYRTQPAVDIYPHRGYLGIPVSGPVNPLGLALQLGA
jgi:hypothetical protein